MSLVEAFFRRRIGSAPPLIWTMATVVIVAAVIGDGDGLLAGGAGALVVLAYQVGREHERLDHNR